MIFDHSRPEYAIKARGMRKWNGAYYYSREIVANIIPNVETTRNWVTVNAEGMCADHSIVFIHNNLKPEMYKWLSDYEDLVLVCGVPSTCAKVEHLGTAVYLPLSVDVAYVGQFKTEKDKGTAFFGRSSKGKGLACDKVCDLPREKLLREMARYEKVYAVGRTAVEAKVLGCEVLPYDERFPDPSVWKVLDNMDAAKMLQKILDGIDGQ